MSGLSTPYTMKTSLLLSAIALASAMVSPAATLADWNFTGAEGPNANTQIPAGNTVVASTFATTSVPGVVIGNITSGTSGIYTSRLSWSNGLWASNEINLQNWDYTGTAGTSGTSGATGDGIQDSWLQFSLADSGGGQVTIDGISMSAWRNGTGAAEFLRWDYSLDNGTTWQQFGSTVTQNEAADSTFRTSNYTGSVSGTSILLRFAPTGGTGNIHINDIQVTGGIVPVPEPSVVLLGGLGVLALLRRRRA